KRQRAAPTAADEALCYRRVNRVQFEPGAGQPFLQVRDRRRVVIIEMASRREELDRLESMRRDVEQVLARQPLAVKEVRRDSELPGKHAIAILLRGPDRPRCSPQLVDVSCEHVAESGESRMLLQVG